MTLIYRTFTLNDSFMHILQRPMLARIWQTSIWLYGDLIPTPEVMHSIQYTSYPSCGKNTSTSSRETPFPEEHETKCSNDLHSNSQVSTSLIHNTTVVWTLSLSLPIEHNKMHQGVFVPCIVSSPGGLGENQCLSFTVRIPIIHFCVVATSSGEFLGL